MVAGTSAKKIDSEMGLIAPDCPPVLSDEGRERSQVRSVDWLSVRVVRGHRLGLPAGPEERERFAADGCPVLKLHEVHAALAQLAF